jgi:hypothetical protein
MFKIIPDPTFAATVNIMAPGGQVQPLKLHFKHRKGSEVQPFFESCKNKPVAEVLQGLIASVDDSEKLRSQTDASFLAELVDNYPMALGNITDAYVQELFQGRQKN